MNLEIHSPELVQRVNQQIQSRQLHGVDELLEKALDALDRQSPAPAQPRDVRTGADLIAALQASPCRELEIEPPRVRIANVRDVVL